MDETTPADGFAAALSFLYDRIDYERNAAVPTRSKGLQLDRMRDLLERLGNPHHDLKIVHVAGTKGKGSTASMIASILVAADFRVGLYTSPHLLRLEERFVIDGQPCTPRQLVDLIDLVTPAVKELDGQRTADDYELTFFEITTAMAFVHFQRSAVAIAVVEVGMGGRLDSTNVCEPLVSVITNISLDHTRQLGNTLGAIAREKAGIIKPGVPIVSGVLPREPRAAIADVADAQRSPLSALGRDFHFEFTPPSVSNTHSKPQGMVHYTEPDTNSGGRTNSDRCLDLSPGLLGRHQAANAAVAVATISRLQAQGWEIADAAIQKGIALATCPSRIELIASQPWVILDTAHNTASIEALIEVLNESFVARRRFLIFAATREKDALGMLRLLLPQFNAVILTQYHDNPRSILPGDLRDMVECLHNEGSHCLPEGQTVTVCPDPASAWQSCRDLMDAESLACITGSFFLAAEIRDALRYECSAVAKPAH